MGWEKTRPSTGTKELLYDGEQAAQDVTHLEHQLWKTRHAVFKIELFDSRLRQRKVPILPTHFNILHVCCVFVIVLMFLNTEGRSGATNDNLRSNNT